MTQNYNKIYFIYDMEKIKCINGQFNIETIGN